MSDKNLYINDLKHRFSGYTFVETSPGVDESIYHVSFLDGSSVEVSAGTGLNFLDCYRKIREDVLNAETPAYLTTTTERDSLSVDDGTVLYNITTSRNECYDGSSWTSSGGTTSGSTVAFGAMYEDNSSGTALSVTTSYTGWNSGTSGVFDGGGIVSFEGGTIPSPSDKLVVGAGGAGAYIVEFHCAGKNSNNALTTAAIHINGTEQTSVKMSSTGNSSNLIHWASCGPLTLAVDDEVDLRFKSTGTDTVTLYQVNVNIDRIEV